jgi:hypothetical protein
VGRGRAGAEGSKDGDDEAENEEKGETMARHLVKLLGRVPPSKDRGRFSVGCYRENDAHAAPVVDDD